MLTDIETPVTSLPRNNAYEIASEEVLYIGFSPFTQVSNYPYCEEELIYYLTVNGTGTIDTNMRIEVVKEFGSYYVKIETDEV